MWSIFLNILWIFKTLVGIQTKRLGEKKNDKIRQKSLVQTVCSGSAEFALSERKVYYNIHKHYNKVIVTFFEFFEFSVQTALLGGRGVRREHP